jgi:hypothetical protein
VSNQTSTPAQPDHSPASTPAPAPKKQRKHAAIKAAAVLGVFVIGTLIGASGAHNTTTTTTVSPASCKTALDSAETIMHASADAFGAVSAAFTAVSKFDTAGIEAQLAPVNEANAKVAAATPGYTTAAADCRAH